jgi:GNAT superfamily N-acetyltransferase
MTTPTDPSKHADHHVELAVMGDGEVLADVIAGAFYYLAVSQWLVPNPDARRAIFPPYFRMFVDHALAEGGVVLTTPARDAVALWLPIGRDGPDAPPEEYHEQLAAITGAHLARFEALDEAFAAHHPSGIVHEHLAILAVRPDRQRLGIGRALLHARHAILDRDGTSAYLEASDPVKRGIYLSFGYEDLGGPIQLPDGPAMYPMIRFPQSDKGAAGSRM